MIQVFLVNSRKRRNQFISFPYYLYRNDPYWIPPLKMERREMIHPKKNPYFHYADVQLFIAVKNGQVVGRISAQVNRLHNERYGEKTGHFGFFDCVDDSLIAIDLFRSAQEWLRQRGMERITGPFSFSLNEECGLLVEGFNSSPFPFMPYNPPYYKKLFSHAGYNPLKELIAWKFDSTRPVTPEALQIAEVVRQHPGLVIREVDPRYMEREVKIISDVFNSAWSKNWGFIPWTDQELKKMAKDLKMILEPKLALIAEVDGKPAAISIAIPNYHEAIRDLKGRLFPFGILKLLWRLKTKKIKSARLALLGVKKEYRGDVLGGLSVLLYTEMHKRSQMLGYWGGELSWTLEDNEKINNGIRLMGGEEYKRYRIYEKALT